LVAVLVHEEQPTVRERESLSTDSLRQNGILTCRTHGHDKPERRFLKVGLAYLARKVLREVSVQRRQVVTYDKAVSRTLDYFSGGQLQE
jgi:hypothetical protein